MTEKTVAVLFTDLVGSTHLTSERGDAAAMRLFRHHAEMVDLAAARHDGRVIKSTGDGLLISFPACPEAVAAALDIRDQLRRHAEAYPDDDPLLVRMGVNVGAAIEEAGDLFGLAVTAAARVAGKAASGQVLVPEEVRAAAGGDWRYVDRGLFWLKGLPRQWRLYEVVGADETVPSLPVLETTTPFVDREEERAELRRRIDALSDARGSYTCLVGPSGTGKSRLAAEMAREAESQGLQALVGRCYEHGGVPHGPIVQILEAARRAHTPESFRAILDEDAPEVARLLPDLRRVYDDIGPPAELPADEQRSFLFRGLTAVLARLAAGRPLVIVADDLNWADEATCSFLEHLASQLSQLPILVIATYANEELTSARPLRRMLASLHRQRLIDSIEITSLDEPAVELLLTAVGGSPPPPALRIALHRATDGNAFYLEELLRHLAAQGRLFDATGGWNPVAAQIDLGVPDSVRLTVEHRLAELPDNATSILTIGAAVGRDFGFEILEAVADIGDDDLVDAIDEAERAHLITSRAEGDSVRFEFANQLIRQTLLDEISLTRRQHLHLRIADGLERLHADALEQHAATIAAHLEQAGRRAAAARRVRFLRMAGARALQAAAYEEALQHLDRALDLVAPSETDARAALLEQLASAERSLGHYDEALAVWDEALSIHESEGRVEAVARVCLDAGAQVAMWRRGPEVTALVNRGLAAIGEVPSAQRAGLLALAGGVASQAARFGEAETLLDEAMTIARNHDDRRVLGLALYSRAVHGFNTCDYTAAVAYGRESIDLLRGGADLWDLANVQGYVGAALGWLGKLGEAAALGRETEALALRVRNWPAFVFAEQAHGFSDIGTHPSPAVLERRGRHINQLAAETGFPWLESIGHGRIGLAQFWRGNWEEALTAFERAAATEMRGAAGGHAGRLFLVHAYLGHTHEALALLEAAAAGFALPGRSNTGTAWTLAASAAEAFALLDRRAEAAALYPTLLAHAETMCLMRSWDFRLVETLCGLCAAAGEDWDRAWDHFTTARRQADATPMVIEGIEVLRFEAMARCWRDDDGDRDEAKALLARAAEGYAQWGMPRHASFAASELDRR